MEIIDSALPYHPGWSNLPLVFSALLVVATSLLTISGFIYKAAVVNPAEALREN